MKKKIFIFISLFVVSISFAQTGKIFWKTTAKKAASTIFEDKKEFRNSLLFELDVLQLQQELIVAPKRSNASVNSNVIISFPNGEGQLEQFRILEFSNMDPVLAAKYSEIKSYLGESISNPSSKIYFSLSPLGLRSMLLKADNSSVFIEPYTTDLSSYIVYKKSDREASLSKFECKTMHQARTDLANDQSFLARPNADDGILRTYRLAVSVTSEYTAYFGGTVPLAMAAINNTMTRVNAIFERDFGVHMNLIANNDILIYNNASTDPYSPASTGVSGNWNIEIQDNLTNTIGNAGYDIGHLFAATGGGGSAGGIGCVCVDDDTSVAGEPAKGSGFSSPSNGVPPGGDAFDLDTVAHELGHQFGARHTFSHTIEFVNTTQMEPGSGSTIMGYAGITNSDVQLNASAYFHAISIQQVIEYLKSKSCQTTTSTSNATPTVNAGLNYTIPKSTPFILTGSGSDIDGDTLSYCWEQMDIALTSTPPNATKTQGPNFRSYDPTLSPARYFPTLSSVLSGATFTISPEVTVEALPSVARTFNFRLTARDNRLFGAANNSDDTVITVNATAGPFLVTSPNTSVSFTGNTFQTITWDVAGTTTNGVNCLYVDILLSTNGGTTFPIILANGTPNDGTQSIAIPNIAGTTNRIMIRGTNHIFFDISNTNFTIVTGTPDTTRPSTPTLSASGTTANSTLLSWTTSTDNLAVTNYDVYKDGLFLINTTLTTLNVTGLIPTSTFLFTVKAKDGAGNESLTSNTVTINTLSPDIVRPLPPTLSASLTTTDTTQLSWSGATDNYSVTGYDVYQGSILLGSTSLTTYAVTNLNAFTTYEFYVKAKDAANNTSVSSNIVRISTLAGAYCASRAVVGSEENIANVQIGTINNSSTGVNGYANFTSISTPLTIGTSQTISITPRWASNVFNEGYGVFIDYNRDGDFDAIGETVWTQSPTTLPLVSGTFTIPLTAVSGSTRMRVSMMFYGVPTPCLTYEFGEVEDYTIILNPAPISSANLSGSDTICRGDSTNVNVKVAITGGVSPYVLVLNNGTSNFTINNYINNSSIPLNPSTNTTYTLISVTDANGNTAGTLTGTSLITVNTLSAAPTAITGTTTICSGESTTLTVSGGTLGSGATVEWFSGSCGGTSAGSGNSITVSPTTNTTYFVRYNGTCNTTTCASQLVTVNSLSTAAVISGSTSICSGSFTNLQVAITGGLTPYSIVYTDGTSNFTANSYLNGSNIPVAPTSSTTYSLVSVQSANGCFGTGNSGSAFISLTSTSTSDGISWSNGIPTSTKTAIFNGNAIIGADLTACSLIVNNGAVVSVASGFDVTLNGALEINSGSFTLENNANLIQTAAINTNVGEIVASKVNSSMRRLDYTYWSSPTAKATYSLKMFSPMTVSLIPFTVGGVTGTSRFYYLDESANAFVNTFEPTTTYFDDANIARGWCIRAPNNFPVNGNTATFNANWIGKPNSGDITIPVTYFGTGKGFNLIGNPYPSTIDALAFLKYSPDSNVTFPNAGTMYFWTHTTQNAGGNNYATFNLSGGTPALAGGPTPNGIIQVGQGFLLKKSVNATAVFNNGMRVGNNQGQFFKSTTIEKNRIWLNLATEAAPLSQMMVGYIEGTTLGFDDSYDGKLINSGSTISSIIDNENYTIQARPTPFANTDEVPLSFNADTAGSYTLSIDHVDGLFFGDQNIYLRDKLLNVTHDIKASAYTFTSEQGTFNSRFDVVYNNATLNVPRPPFDANAVIVYGQGNGFVVNSGNFAMSSIKVFDIRGRLIDEKKEINDKQAYIDDCAANQVLLVQITLENGIVFSKKVIR